MNFFNEIADRILQCDDTETRITQEDCQKKNETWNEGCDEMLEIFHMEIEFLERWLKEPEGEMKLAEPNTEEIVVTVHDKDEMFLTFIELSECYNISNNNVVAGTEGNINKYDVEIREIEQKVFGDEMKNQEQQESYVFRDIREIEVLNQQDKDESSQQFKTRSTEIQKVYDGILVLEASKEVERSYIFKTNNFFMNADT